MAVTPRPRALLAAFGADRLIAHRVLAPMTTFGIGGPADWFLETRSTDETVTAIRCGREDSIPVVVLGGGSNVLIGDLGVRGLVLHPRAGAIARVGEGAVRADAGVTLNRLVRWTVLEGLGGLEAWAGTPGSVGGAIVGNAHWGGRLIGELVTAVGLLDRTGTVQVVPAAEMEFGYDRSRLQRTGEVLLWVELALTPGRPSADLRVAARASLVHRKGTQPLRLPSAGCVFQNPVRGVDVVPQGIPWSAGALIERTGLKGCAIGGARVSPVHANFIVNEGGATARDVRALVEKCRAEVLRQFGVALRAEIVCIGEF